MSSQSNITVNSPITIYTVKEVAKMFKTNSNYVYKLINEGQINAIKLGSYKITNQELDRFINNITQKQYQA